MTEPSFRYLSRSTDQGVLVLTLIEAQLQGDELVQAVYQELLAAVVAETQLFITLLHCGTWAATLYGFRRSWSERTSSPSFATREAHVCAP